MRPDLAIPGDTLANQALASDPDASAWVSANAGSGKTFVLTRRVLRLLLAGADPQTILCLTYTKAAAAEMRQRVTGELARWALMDDGALARTLLQATGQPAPPQTIALARTLFARALETPGGLKINTIHAFCESVLHRFPLEAGVPVDFSVIEDEARIELTRRSREAVLAEGLAGDPDVAEAVSFLFSALSDAQIEAAIAQALNAGRQLDPVLRDPHGADVRLRAFLGLGPGETEQSLLAEALERTLVPFSDYRGLFAVAPPGPGRRFEDKLARIDPQAPTLDALFSAYLTADGSVPARLLRKECAEKLPDLAERFFGEAQRLAGLYERRKGVALAACSKALTSVLRGIAARYEGEKRARSLLDFDDLVTRAAALFSNPEHGAWVRYKLDVGIDHILVDESQDTNGEQWRVVAALAEEFFAGQGVAGKDKTLFAVGDPKQSIYSFQGARPALFVDAGRDYRRKAGQAGRPWHHLPLSTSFRTLSHILSGVDRVCAPAPIAAALLAEAGTIAHESARRPEGGLIEMWPPFSETPAPLPSESWPLEPLENFESAPRRLARRIARTVAHWVEARRPLGPRGRPVRPEDVMILVQSRGPLFAEIVRALREAGVPSPGADRLPVSTHIVVEDLLGLADLLLNPADDLLLAALLRSPLFEVSEESLFALASGRGREPLWSRLAGSDDPTVIAARDQLEAWRSRLDLDRPYEFFADILYSGGGLKRFHARLGTEIDEVVAEFLDLALAHEGAAQPSLTGFVAAMRGREVTVKRDLAEKGAGTRVMTVHGAKGLEAPIVILADATATPPPVRKCVYFGGGEGVPFLLHAPGRKDLPFCALPLREAEETAQTAEYWRKLYVAMTRAEDELYLAGTVSERKTGKASWFEAVAEALAPDAETPADPDADWLLRFPKDRPAPGTPAPGPEHTDPERVPLHLHPLPPKPATLLVSPSLALEAADPETLLATRAEAARDAEAARAEGMALHALLQHLDKVPGHLRAGVARQAASGLLPGRPAGAVAAAALAILGDPSLAPLFGPNSRAEVSFALPGKRGDRTALVSGRIDRLVVEPGRVLVVDYKSDAAPPGHKAEVPPAYLLQLGLYLKVAQTLFPDKRPEAAILWTATRTLMPLGTDRLLEAAGAFTLTGPGAGADRR